MSDDHLTPDLDRETGHEYASPTAAATRRQRILYALGGVLLLAFGFFALTAFQETLTPYVPYETARSVDRQVQVAGGLEAGSSDYDAMDHHLRFTLVDPESGDTLPVRYTGVKPANFEDAVSIVAIGRWEEGSSEFAADQLLVKCPSKYQGLEGEEEMETKVYG